MEGRKVTFGGLLFPVFFHKDRYLVSRLSACGLACCNTSQPTSWRAFYITADYSNCVYRMYLSYVHVLCSYLATTKHNVAFFSVLFQCNLLNVSHTTKLLYLISLALLPADFAHHMKKHSHTRPARVEGILHGDEVAEV